MEKRKFSRQMTIMKVSVMFYDRRKPFVSVSHLPFATGFTSIGHSEIQRGTGASFEL